MTVISAFAHTRVPHIVKDSSLKHSENMACKIVHGHLLSNICTFKVLEEEAVVLADRKIRLKCVIENNWRNGGRK